MVVGEEESEGRVGGRANGVGEFMPRGWEEKK